MRPGGGGGPVMVWRNVGCFLRQGGEGSVERRGVGDQKKIKQTCGKGDAIVLFLLWHLK